VHRFEITEFQRLPGWEPQAGEVSLRVVDPTPRLIEIRHTRIYHRGNGRLALGPPFVWACGWDGRHSGFGFVDEATCDAAEEVVELVRAACPALACGGRP
jgi:hypothetical protein